MPLRASGAAPDGSAPLGLGQRFSQDDDLCLGRELAQVARLPVVVPAVMGNIQVDIIRNTLDLPARRYPVHMEDE